MEIQSNSIRGDFKEEIMSKTINEIHDAMTTVFGPYATDAYLIKDQMPYYTRDGKEVMQSLSFDNPISNTVASMMFQAVKHQADKVGDGTTTLAVFYTNLYTKLKDLEAIDPNFNISRYRESYNKLMGMIIDELKTHATDLTETDLKSMLYTCTQDAQLAQDFYDKLHDAIMEEAYIIPKKSNNDTELEVVVHTEPFIHSTKLFSLKPVADDATIENCNAFYINGNLDIGHVETLLSLISIELGEGIHPNICFICNGMTDATRNTLKLLTTRLKETGIQPENFSNIIVFQLRDFRSYKDDMIEDLVAFFYNEEGVGGLVQSITFEAYLYQALTLSAYGSIESLDTVDPDTAILGKLKEAFCNVFDIKYDSLKGVMFTKPFNHLTKARYAELRAALDNEKSEIRKIEMRNRLKTIYGRFIEVEVGSKLLKDSQRKYELILDAILSSLDAVRHGVLRDNSIILAIQACAAIRLTLNTVPDYNLAHADYSKLLEAVNSALLLTLVDMIGNKTSEAVDLVAVFGVGDDLTKYHPEKSFNLRRVGSRDWYSDVDDFDFSVPNGEIISARIVEPVSVMTAMLEDSTVMLELACAKMFNVDSFIGNYLPKIN